jgi:hypothetical protein
MDHLPLCSPWFRSYLPPYYPQLPPFYLPTILYLHTSSNAFFSHLNAPIHIVYQPSPPTPHFRFFGPLLAIPLLPAPFPTIKYLLQLLPKVFYPLPDPSYTPYPCLLPQPPFSHFGTIYGRIFAFISVTFCLHMYIHD